MKKMILMISVSAVLSTSIISESWAETTCTWQGTKLIVSGSGSFSGCGSANQWNQYKKIVTEVVLDENITTIKSGAFGSASNLRNISMPGVTTIEDSAFIYDDKIESIDMPKVQTIGSTAFFHNTGIIYLGMPEDVSLGKWALNYFVNSYTRPSLTVLGNCTNLNGYKSCGTCGNDYIKTGTGCVKDCGAGYLGKEGRCIDSALGCGEGYKQVENWCNRIQWTPAEAAKVLKDDNTNEVTITFKK